VKWSGNIAIRHGSGQDSIFMAATPDTRKLYQQVASTIMASIIGGNYKPGERLPSETRSCRRIQGEPADDSRGHDSP